MELSGHRALVDAAPGVGGCGRDAARVSFEWTFTCADLERRLTRIDSSPRSGPRRMATDLADACTSGDANPKPAEPGIPW